MTLVGTRFAAGLSKRVVTLPSGVSQFTFTYKIKPSALASVYAQVYENDLMFVDSKGNRFNGSVRKNNDLGGMWQIVNAAGQWVAVFQAGLFPTEVWTTVTIVFKINWTALTIAVISITDGTQKTFVIANPMNNPAIQDDPLWEPNIIDWQSQGTINENVIAPAIVSYTQEMMDVCVYGQ